jgi:hypothetical protein
MTYMIILGLILLSSFVVVIGSTLPKVGFGEPLVIFDYVALAVSIASSLILVSLVGHYFFQVLN